MLTQWLAAEDLIHYRAKLKNNKAELPKKACLPPPKKLKINKNKWQALYLKLAASLHLNESLKSCSDRNGQYLQSAVPPITHEPSLTCLSWSCAFSQS